MYSYMGIKKPEHKSGQYRYALKRIVGVKAFV
jgi:hypothetical protein